MSSKSDLSGKGNRQIKYCITLCSAEIAKVLVADFGQQTSLVDIDIVFNPTSPRSLHTGHYQFLWEG
jgi:hypothetical protein